MGYQNFFATTLYTDIGASDTVITLETIPAVTSGRLVLEARNPTQREIISYSGIAGNQITGVVRGLGGTTAKSHTKNSLVEMNLTAEDLTDALSVPNDIKVRFDESLADFIVAGTGIVAQTIGLVGSFSDITYYINGGRYTKAAIPNKTYTISKDTYVFIDINGTVTYTEVANNATAPAKPAFSILVAKVVTNGTAITSVTPMNRGSVTANEIDFTVAGRVWWEELGRIEVTTASSSNLVLNIPVDKRRRKYTLIATFEKNNAGTHWLGVNVNGDFGNTYQNIGWTYERSNGAGGWQNSNIANMGEVKTVASGGGGMIEISISRGANGGWWLFRNSCSGDQYAKQTGGRWENSAEITSITLATNGAVLNIGSTLILLGHD